MSMEVGTETETETKMEMEMEMEVAMETEMEMEMVMVITGSLKASSEFRFASKWVLTSDFEVLEAPGLPRGDQVGPERSQEAPRSFRGVRKKLPRGSLEVLGELLDVQKGPEATALDTFIGFRGSKKPPGGPQVTIYRPADVLEPPGGRPRSQKYA